VCTIHSLSGVLVATLPADVMIKVLRRVASKHNTSIANVASRWVLQQPAVPAVILGARNASHVHGPSGPVHLHPGPSRLDDIQQVLAAGRQAKGDCYDLERGGKW